MGKIIAILFFLIIITLAIHNIEHQKHTQKCFSLYFVSSLSHCEHMIQIKLYANLIFLLLSLETWNRTNSWKYAGSQALMTEIFLGPMLCISYMCFQQTLYHNNNLKETIIEVKRKTLPTLISNFCYWPAMDFLNFFYTPAHYKVFVMLGQDLMWSFILSAVNNNL